MKQHRLNVQGLACPLPLLKAKQALSAIDPGDQLAITATDAGSFRDIPAFIQQTNHQLIECLKNNGIYQFVIQKGVLTPS